jgi:hypothetical protein
MAEYSVHEILREHDGYFSPLAGVAKPQDDLG